MLVVGLSGSVLMNSGVRPPLKNDVLPGPAGVYKTLAVNWINKQFVHAA